MTKIIGLLQVNGGPRRSTVATNLAGRLSQLGKAMLIDCNMPQGANAVWSAVRDQAGKTGDLAAHAELAAKLIRCCHPRA